MTSVRNIEGEFVVLSPDQRATIEPCDAGLYPRLDETYQGFTGHELIACYSFTNDWPTWEMHPAGDEVVMLLAGEATFVLKLADQEQSLTLATPGDYVVVPKGAWHTARINTFAKVLFITPGEGTQNAAIQPSENPEEV